jgi:hypothetical protein
MAEFSSPIAHHSQSALSLTIVCDLIDITGGQDATAALGCFVVWMPVSSRTTSPSYADDAKGDSRYTSTNGDRVAFCARSSHRAEGLANEEPGIWEDLVISAAIRPRRYAYRQRDVTPVACVNLVRFRQRVLDPFSRLERILV